MIVPHRVSHERDIREAINALISRRCFDCVELIKLRMAMSALRLLSDHTPSECIRIDTEAEAYEIDVRDGQVASVRHRRGSRLRSRELAT